MESMMQNILRFVIFLLQAYSEVCCQFFCLFNSTKLENVIIIKNNLNWEIDMGNNISHQSDSINSFKGSLKVQKFDQKLDQQIEHGQTILSNRSDEYIQTRSRKSIYKCSQIRASKDLFHRYKVVQKSHKIEEQQDVAYRKFQDKRKNLQLFQRQRNKLSPITFSTFCSIEEISLHNYHSDQIQDDKQSNLNIESPSKDQIEFIQNEILNFLAKFIDYSPLTQIKHEYFIRIKKSNIRLDYIFQDQLGEGAFGSVYQCINRKSGQKRAIKVLKQSLFINPRIKQQFFQQFTILKKVNHPNIIKIFQIYHHQNMMYIVSQLCRGGTLGSLMKHYPYLNSKLIKQIMLQLFRGIAYLHHIHILHRDIKPDNIALMNEINQFSTPDDIDIRIIDFGLAIQNDQKSFKDWAKIGTISYMAPEVFNGVYSKKCDTWSCGVVMYLLYTNHHPFIGLTETELRQKINTFVSDFNDYNDTIEGQMKKIISKMLSINYQSRVNISEVLKFGPFQPKACNFDKKTVLRKIQCYYRGNNLISFIQSYLSFIHSNYKQYTSIFHYVNKEQNGHISLKQFTEFILEIDKNYPYKEIIYLFQKLNKSGSGLIDFGEFVLIFLDSKQFLNDSNLQQVFKFIDLNNNNKLQKEQMKFFLKSLTKQEIDGLFTELESRKQNFTSFQFINIIKSLK